MTREVVERVLERADDLIVEAMNERTVPGSGVGVVSGSETVYAKGFGFADIERGRPATPKTVFRIGSISKTMTAIGLMQLWERGEFQLDDPVNEYLMRCRVEHPDPAAPPVIFRHMLTHTAGIGELRRVTDLLRPVIGLGAKPDGPTPTPPSTTPEISVRRSIRARSGRTPTTRSTSWGSSSRTSAARRSPGT